ncbi:MAG: prolyl oligopeptidase family serine peptidase [Bacteroidota bacterium]
MQINFRKIKILLLLYAVSIGLFAQHKEPEDFGFSHHTIQFNDDIIDILIQTKTGEENKTKPALLFCQGSLPIPLIKTAGNTIYGVFPFDTDSLLKDYHLVIISKPYIPVIIEAEKLAENFLYIDSTTGKVPSAYTKRNYLDYYVYRNIAVVDYLQTLPFISTKKLIVAGHSQGCTIAAKMATLSKKITHLIIASGNPFGQITSMLREYRRAEKPGDSTNYGDELLNYWESVVANKDNNDDVYGDTYKSIYDFSTPAINYLLKIKIPTFVCYGSKDINAPYNDYLRIETIRQQKENFTFKAYLGREHNFFSVKEKGEINYNDFGWNKVADDWKSWLLKNR